MKIYLFGKNGMLGNTVCSYLSQFYTINAFDRNDFNPLVHTLEDLQRLFHSLNEEDIIINCIGIIPQRKNMNTVDYFLINSQFPHFLDSIAKSKCARFIHISTNCVFDNNIYEQNENCIPTATDVYGLSKHLGEPVGSTIIRTSIIGEEINTHLSLLSWALSNSGPIDGFTDHFWNGVTCLQLAKCMKQMIEKNIFWKGVRHIFSNETVSKYELLKIILSIYKHPISINKKRTETLNKKTLSSIYPSLFDIPPLFQQISEQKLFLQIQKVPLANFSFCKPCRFCSGDTMPWFTFEGKYPLAGGFLMEGHETEESAVPLSISFCKECELLQCNELISSDILFKNGYFYFSSMIPFLVSHFKAFSELLIKEYSDPLYKKQILEIGCNDGVLLRNLQGNNFKTIGVDPSHTVNSLIQDGFTIYNEYFTKETAEKIVNEHGQVDIFISSNSFAHINDMKNILDGLKIVLKKDGSAIIEVHNSLNILTNLNFDFIYHEHMTYYTKTSFCKIFERIGMHVHRIDDINVHGGSMRIFIKNSDTPSLSMPYSNKLISDSDEFRLQLDKFPAKLFDWKKQFQTLFFSLKQEGKTIFGYGASGRANIFLRFLDIELDGIVDDADSKIGALMPFTHTKIKNSSTIYDTNSMPDYIILISWAYKETILKKHSEYIRRGGKFIIPLPTIEIIEKPKENL